LLSLRESKEGVIFEVLLQPRSSRNEISGIHEDCLKIRIASPPVEGKANQACIDFIARSLGLRRSEVEMISGHTSRRKRLLARNITIEDFKRRLNHFIE
jgi:hypothetical protein